jgi:hypothetical protein
MLDWRRKLRINRYLGPWRLKSTRRLPTSNLDVRDCTRYNLEIKLATGCERFLVVIYATGSTLDKDVLQDVWIPLTPEATEQCTSDSDGDSDGRD